MYIKIENDIITEIYEHQVDNTFYFDDDVLIEVGWSVHTWTDGFPTGFSSPPTILTEEEITQDIYNSKVEQVQKFREELLKESDWIVIRAVDTNTDIPTEWQVYRQALRDITIHPNYPDLLDSDWPVKPTI